MGRESELLEAARNGNVCIVDKILSSRARRSGPLASLRRGPGPNVQDSTGYTALHHGALNGHKDVVTLLLHYEASVNLPDSKGSTPLHLAAWGGHIDVIEELLKHQGHRTRCNVNLQNKDGETAFHCAARFGHSQAVKLLLAAGGDPTIVNTSAETPLDLAAQFGHFTTVEILVRTHPDLLSPYTPDAASSAVFPHTPLHRAALKGDLAVVKLLVNQGHTVNVKTSKGGPLHLAVLSGKVDVVKVLLEAGADADIRDDDGQTVLDKIKSIHTSVTQEITSLIKSRHAILVDIGSSSSSDTDSSRPPSFVPPPPPNPKFCHPGDIYVNVLLPCLRPTSLTPDRKSLVSSQSSAGSASALVDPKPHPYVALKVGTASSPEVTDLVDHISEPPGMRLEVGNGSKSPLRPFSCPGIPILSADGGRGEKNGAVPGTPSDWSVYDIPVPPRPVSASHVPLPPNRHESLRVASEKEESLYDVPSPPRPCSSDVSLPPRPVSADPRASGIRIPPHKSVPPPKPPRRSVCPPSPTPGSESAPPDDGPYEFICFNNSGRSSSREYENLPFHKQSPSCNLLSVERPPSQRNGRSSSTSPRNRQRLPASTRQPDSSASDSEDDFLPIPVVKMFKDMKFKPVKSRRINRPLHSYENVQNLFRPYQTLSLKFSSNPPPHPKHPPLPRRQRTVATCTDVSRECRKCSSDEDDLDSDSSNSGPPLRATIPLSPTNYQQPPTPDHPPPPPSAAQISINQKIRPVSECLKRASRDIETETEPEEVLSVAIDASSSSVSSVSLSDKSASTDNIEEVHSERPFAGLYRGSITQMNRERPRSLSTPSLRNSTDKGGTRNSLPSSIAASNASSSSADTPNSTVAAPLSPLDEADEWARINDIMNSFGSGLARESVFMNEIMQEFQEKLGFSLSSSNSTDMLDAAFAEDETTSGLTVASWLRELDLQHYEDLFVAHGYDDIAFLNGSLDASDLTEIGVDNDSHCESLLVAVSKMPSVLPPKSQSFQLPDSLEEWLQGLHLNEYLESFQKNGFESMERVKKIWEVELTAVLEVSKLGHRRRILASLGERPLDPDLPPILSAHDLSLELCKLNSDISQLKEHLFQELPDSASKARRPPESSNNTIRKQGAKKRSAPLPPLKLPRIHNNVEAAFKGLTIRDPSQVALGISNVEVTSWKHDPKILVSSSVQYVAEYLGSTHVKDLRGRESTMKSIHKLRRTTGKGGKAPRIVLAVCYQGVKFIDAENKDAEDLTHFAYITKDIDTKGHYCHVFRVETLELATEVILTLGEAFEVAYQLALKNQSSLNQSDDQKIAFSHCRSLSEDQGRPVANGVHSRSHSTSLSGCTSSTENLLSDSGNLSARDSSPNLDSPNASMGEVGKTDGL